MNHERAERLVRNEVYVCLSSLVSVLAQGGTSGNDLTELCEQAYELASPVLDYEEAARQAGYIQVTYDNSLEVWIGKEDEGIEDCPEWTDAQEVCEGEGIDPYEWEVYEHWAVSQALADDLIAVGERVDTDFAGMCVWARTCTGQAIAADGCITRVLELHDKLWKCITEESDNYVSQQLHDKRLECIKEGREVA